MIKDGSGARSQIPNQWVSRRKTSRSAGRSAGFEQDEFAAASQENASKPWRKAASKLRSCRWSFPQRPGRIPSCLSGMEYPREGVTGGAPCPGCARRFKPRWHRDRGQRLWDQRRAAALLSCPGKGGKPRPKPWPMVKTATLLRAGSQGLWVWALWKAPAGNWPKCDWQIDDLDLM